MLALRRLLGVSRADALQPGYLPVTTQAAPPKLAKSVGQAIF